MSRSSHPVKIRCSHCGKRFTTEFKLTAHDRRAHAKPESGRKLSRARFVEPELDDDGFELYASNRSSHAPAGSIANAIHRAAHSTISGHDRRAGNTPPNPNHHATRGIHNG